MSAKVTVCEPPPDAIRHFSANLQAAARECVTTVQARGRSASSLKFLHLERAIIKELQLRCLEARRDSITDDERGVLLWAKSRGIVQAPPT